MSEFPPPIRLFGEPELPREPYGARRRDDPPPDDYDRFGAEAAAAALTERLRQVQPAAGRLGEDGRAMLWPPLSLARDHVAGPVSAPATLLVFGAFGTPASRELGRTIESARERHIA